MPHQAARTTVGSHRYISHQVARTPLCTDISRAAHPPLARHHISHRAARTALAHAIYHRAATTRCRSDMSHRAAQTAVGSPDILDQGVLPLCTQYIPAGGTSPLPPDILPSTAHAVGSHRYIPSGGAYHRWLAPIYPIRRRVPTTI
ncbi:hypothetical protein AVEN_46336-1 [Araneus ventricosus]|uniref:Uncharacterized protein n=1 Tax=Araneus ventricosus TaxID=182803 RepID=A0A4Y2KUA1_ARAVE|nr:hypothetical protein AVEN_46336-1 [Araneus ventricosus]